MKHLLSIRHLEPPQIQELLDLGAEFKRKVLAGESTASPNPKIFGLLFFEGSTRTRVSFEQAAHYLGHKVTNFSGTGSSMSKGETLKDTILTLRYERLEAVVMRHSASGSAQLAAQFFGSPVINAGDGQHEHPTQALGDALTIIERKGKLDGLTVAIVGDVLHSRVARSNAWLLSKMGATVRFVGPKTLMPAHSGKLPGENYYDLAAGIEGADVIMCLRLQKERMTDGLLSSTSAYSRGYQINSRTIRAARKDCIVMHPGPMNRGIELDDVTADGANSMIQQQVENCIFVRMAAMEWVFAEEKVATKSGGKK